MSHARLLRTIAEGERLVLDSTALISYFEANEAASELSRTIIEDFVSSGRNVGLISTISVMEILIRPLRSSATAPYHHVMEFVQRFPNLTVVPVDLSIAQEAASIRATYNLSVPDSLIVATGVVTQVQHIVTNDAAWARKLRPLGQRISVLGLRDYL